MCHEEKSAVVACDTDATLSKGRPRQAPANYGWRDAALLGNRRRRPMATESSEELRRHHAYMAYLLGHATMRLPLEADLWWRAAEGETDLPAPLQGWRSGTMRWVEDLLKGPV